MSEWQLTFSRVHEGEGTKDYNTILQWYNKSSNPAENPALILGINENAKNVVQFIIGGLINAKAKHEDINLLDIIIKLKEYYNDSTLLKDKERNSELLIFYMILKANTILAADLPDNSAPYLLFDKTFMPVPRYTIIDEKAAKDALTLCGKPTAPSNIEIDTTYVDDFVEHFKPQLLQKIGFNEYVGVKKTGLEMLSSEIIQFLNTLQDRKVLSVDTLEKLNNLQDKAEDDSFNNEANYNYEIKLSHTWCNIILSIIELLKGHTDKDFGEDDLLKQNLKNVDNRLTPIKDFAIDMVQNGIYKRLNRKGTEIPKDLFFNFYMKYFSRKPEKDVLVIKETIQNELRLLKWFFSKLNSIFTQSEIVEIKTQECLYDLFDSIDLLDDEIFVNDSGNIVEGSEGDYPLRTIHFRKDFIIHSDDGTTIDGFNIPKYFWYHVDKTICWRKKPLSVFLGILKEADKLEPLFYTLIWELGKEFRDDKQQTMAKMATSVGKLLPSYCTIINPLIIPEPTPYFPKYIDTTDFINAHPSSIYTQKVTHALFLIFTENNNRSVINKLLEEISDISIENLGPYEKIENMTDETIKGYRAIENSLFEIAKVYNLDFTNMDTIIKRKDFDNVKPINARQIHNIIQQEKAYVEIEDIMIFNKYLVNSILGKEATLLWENHFQNYSHILFNEEFFNTSKAYYKNNLKTDLDKMTMLFKKLAVPQTQDQKLKLLLDTMMLDFNKKTKEDYRDGAAAAGKPHDEINSNIQKAASGELLRKSTLKNRIELFNTLKKNSPEAEWLQVCNVAIAASEKKYNDNKSFEASEEHAGVLKHINELSQISTNDRIKREIQRLIRKSRLDQTGEKQAIPTIPSETTGNLTNVMEYLESRANIARFQYELEETMNEKTIKNLKAEVKFMKNKVQVHGTDVTKWNTYFQTTLIKLAEEKYKPLILKGHYHVNINNIKLIIDTLRDETPNFRKGSPSDLFIQNFETELKAETDKIKGLILHYSENPITKKMPEDLNKNYVEEINAIKIAMNELLDDVSFTTIQNFYIKVDILIKLTYARGDEKVSNEWVRYLVSCFKDLIYTYQELSKINFQYKKNTLNILKVYSLYIVIIKIANDFQDTLLDTEMNLALENYDRMIENLDVKHFLTEKSFYSDNSITTSYTNIFEYFATKINVDPNDDILKLVKALTADLANFIREGKITVEAFHTRIDDLILKIQTMGPPPGAPPGTVSPDISQRDKINFTTFFRELKSQINDYAGNPYRSQVMICVFKRAVMLSEITKSSIINYNATINKLLGIIRGNKTEEDKWLSIEFKSYDIIFNMLKTNVENSCKYISYVKFDVFINNLITIFRRNGNNASLIKLEEGYRAAEEHLHAFCYIPGGMYPDLHKYNFEYTHTYINKEVISEINKFTKAKKKLIDEYTIKGQPAITEYLVNSREFKKLLSRLGDDEGNEEVNKIYFIQIRTLLRYIITEEPSTEQAKIQKLADILKSNDNAAWKDFMTDYNNPGKAVTWYLKYFPELTPHRPVVNPGPNPGPNPDPAPPPPPPPPPPPVPSKPTEIPGSDTMGQGASQRVGVQQAEILFKRSPNEDYYRAWENQITEFKAAKRDLEVEIDSYKKAILEEFFKDRLTEMAKPTTTAPQKKKFSDLSKIIMPAYLGMGIVDVQLKTNVEAFQKANP